MSGPSRVRSLAGDLMFINGLIYIVAVSLPFAVAGRDPPPRAFRPLCWMTSHARSTDLSRYYVEDRCLTCGMEYS